ncbi:esterase-like activity of phytase family protein [Cognatishimia sp. F0-27]|uniref:esterase-like activity of phytase family protein n=1 Tax=Cognatishimia sp. F0-27 TaxID=2816855 RepID=UPI001D0CC11B|nr:esterase-like activity of phytase family protein [Cognatishimia sp. F0-27]MCC1491246.1 esterase-like activity of phytase family protein [Cognatishimia sp. F0-27]
MLAASAAVFSAVVPTAEDSTLARQTGMALWPEQKHMPWGLSAIEVEPDGIGFVVVSDRGFVHHGRFLREDGRLVGIEPVRSYFLRNAEETIIGDDWADAEALAITSDGRRFFSFEQQHRVAEYDHLSLVETLPRAPFDGMVFNAGLEALAADAQDRLYAIGERSGGLTEPFPVWRFDGQGWTHAYDLPRKGGFLVTGADFGPDGRLYVLEREFGGLGFRSRVRRVTLGAERILDIETVMQSDLWEHDNLEGIAVWRDSDGAVRITLVSDDNGVTLLQRTEFVEYVLEDALAVPPEDG